MLTLLCDFLFHSVSMAFLLGDSFLSHRNCSAPCWADTFLWPTKEKASVQAFKVTDLFVSQDITKNEQSGGGLTM